MTADKELIERADRELLADLGARLGRGEVIGRTPFAIACWHALARLEALTRPLEGVERARGCYPDGSPMHADDCQSHIVDVRGVPDDCTCGVDTAQRVDPSPEAQPEPVAEALPPAPQNAGGE